MKKELPIPITRSNSETAIQYTHIERPHTRPNIGQGVCRRTRSYQQLPPVEEGAYATPEGYPSPRELCPSPFRSLRRSEYRRGDFLEIGGDILHGSPRSDGRITPTATMVH